MIVFRNAGLIDLRAVNTVGLSAKPATKSPIGYFGTGLKYAIAIVLRLGGKITIYRGKRAYTFTRKRIKFRDTHVFMVHMNGSAMNYTTDLGKHWDAWMAYRELHANALDENGEIFFSDQDPGGEPGKTTIVVDGADFDDIYENRRSIFLEGTPVHKQPGLEVHLGESGVIYYKGMRAMTLKVRSAWTWNITGPMELTEDRTLKYPFVAESVVERGILECTKPEIISAVLTAPGDSWEGKLSYDVTYATIGSTFMDVAANLKAAKAKIAPGALKLFTQKAKESLVYVDAVARKMAPVEQGMFDMACRMVADRLQISIAGKPVFVVGEDNVRILNDRIHAPASFFDQSVSNMACDLLQAYAAFISRDGSAADWLSRVIILGTPPDDEESSPQKAADQGATWAI